MLQRIINYFIRLFRKTTIISHEKDPRVSKRLHRRSWKKEDESSIFATSLFISNKPKERIYLTDTKNQNYSIYTNIRTLSAKEKLTLITELVKEIKPKQKIFLYSKNDLSIFVKCGLKQIGITTTGYPILIKTK